MLFGDPLPHPLRMSYKYGSIDAFKGRNLMQKMMWASASSIVFMVRVDCTKVGDKGMRCFRDYIDGHNKHIIRLAEKDVYVGEKRYKYFAMQESREF